jgi:hypothetical protein
LVERGALIGCADVELEGTDGAEGMGIVRGGTGIVLNVEVSGGEKAADGSRGVVGANDGIRNG